MALEPASAAASAAGAVAAGAGAVVLSTLGLDAAALFWSLLGATIGMSFAAATTRWRAVIVFVAVVLVCSLFGAFIAQKWSGGEVLARNSYACILAIAFHPLLNAAITRVPAALDSLMRMLPGGKQP